MTAFEKLSSFKQHKKESVSVRVKKYICSLVLK